jgi:iron complex outermembrane receptor protein
METKRGKLHEDISAINAVLKLEWIGITGQQDIGVSYPSIPLYLISNSTAQYNLEHFGSTTTLQ